MQEVSTHFHSHSISNTSDLHLVAALLLPEQAFSGGRDAKSLDPTVHCSCTPIQWKSIWSIDGTGKTTHHNNYYCRLFFLYTLESTLQEVCSPPFLILLSAMQASIFFYKLKYQKIYEELEKVSLQFLSDSATGKDINFTTNFSLGESFNRMNLLQDLYVLLFVNNRKELTAST